MSHLDTHMHTRFTRTHIIQHRKTFLCHPIICNRNYCTKINYHNIHNFPQSCFTCHHKPLHTYMIQNTKIFAPYYQLQQKILYKINCNNLHNSTHAWFTRHCTLLHMTTRPHQTKTIQKYIPAIRNTSPLGCIIIKSIKT